MAEDTNRCICPDPLDGVQVADCMIHGWSKVRRSRGPCTTRTGCALMLERLLGEEPGTPGFQRIGSGS